MAKRDETGWLDPGKGLDKATAARFRRRVAKELKERGIDLNKIGPPHLIQGDESNALVAAFNDAMDKKRRRSIN